MDDMRSDAVQAYALFINDRDDIGANEFDAFYLAAMDFAMRRMDRGMRVPPVKPKAPLFRLAGFWKRVKGL